MSIFKSKKVRFSVLAMAAVLILGIVGSALAVAGFHENKIYGGPVANSDLVTARGVVFDWAETWDASNGERNWMISGEWALDCVIECDEVDTNAERDDVKFDMAFAMVRDTFKGGKDGKGASSHGHIFDSFIATEVSTTASEITIVGTIRGSGPIGSSSDGITIKLKRHGSPLKHFSFFFKMSDGNVLTTEVGGAVVESGS